MREVVCDVIYCDPRLRDAACATGMDRAVRCAMRDAARDAMRCDAMRCDAMRCAMRCDAIMLLQVMEREEAREVIKDYTTFLGQLADCEKNLIEAWGDSIESSSQVRTPSSRTTTHCGGGCR